MDHRQRMPGYGNSTERTPRIPQTPGNDRGGDLTDETDDTQAAEDAGDAERRHVIEDGDLVTYNQFSGWGNTGCSIRLSGKRQRIRASIRKEMQSFLKFLLADDGSRHVISRVVGTFLGAGGAVGFSAILMAEYDPVPCQMYTDREFKKKKKMKIPRIPIAKGEL